MPKKVVIIANGQLPDEEQARELVHMADLLICADGGAAHALRLGLRPHLVIGDMDSLTPAQLDALRDTGAHLIAHPASKDETDLELALLRAVEQGAEEILILGALGGRADQTLANVLLLARPELGETYTRIIAGKEELFLINGEGYIKGQPGDTVSLLPLAGDAKGITTEGLEYALHEGTLRFGLARGVSNVLTAPRAHVQVREGLLLCVVIHRGG